MAKKKDQSFVMAANIFSDPSEELYVSPAFDLAVGKIPLGSWVNIAGKPKLGKSTLSLHIIKKFLAKYPQSKCRYADIERRLKKLQLTQSGLQIDQIEVQRSEKGNIITAEQHLELLTEFLKENERCIVVIDSTSLLCSEKEYIDPVTGNTRSLGPKMLANFCRKNASIVPVQEHIVIMISHVIANTSGYGKANVVDSGNKIQYQSDISLMVKKKEDWIEDSKIVGQKSLWEVEWSATKAPGMEMTSCLRYDYGIDEEYEMCEIASEFGLIQQGGAWYTLEFLEDEEGKSITGAEKPIKLNGMAKVYQYFKENTIVYEKLVRDLGKMMT